MAELNWTRARRDSNRAKKRAESVEIGKMAQEDKYLNRSAFRSKYTGTKCNICKSKIHKGEYITSWTDSRFKATWVHNRCRPDPLPTS